MIKVAQQQPEITSVGDIAALKVPGECFNDFEKLSKEVTALRAEEFVRNIAQKIRKFGDDILDTMEEAGGHTLEKHVSQTINNLTKRAAQDPKVNVASSFIDKHSAINAVKENLRNNAEEIAGWLKSNPASKDQLVVDSLHKYPVGSSVSKGNKASMIIKFKNAFLTESFRSLT